MVRGSVGALIGLALRALAFSGGAAAAACSACSRRPAASAGASAMSTTLPAASLPSKLRRTVVPYGCALADRMRGAALRGGTAVAALHHPARTQLPPTSSTSTSLLFDMAGNRARLRTLARVLGAHEQEGMCDGRRRSAHGKLEKIVCGASLLPYCVTSLSVQLSTASSRSGAETVTGHTTFGRAGTRKFATSHCVPPLYALACTAPFPLVSARPAATLTAATQRHLLRQCCASWSPCP
ncbi:hypothetical protein EON67_03980 [archaeon]|nr:MAG: hypothetical protein EON67_03980 [archaeon]